MSHIQEDTKYNMKKYHINHWGITGNFEQVVQKGHVFIGGDNFRDYGLIYLNINEDSNHKNIEDAQTLLCHSTHHRYSDSQFDYINNPVHIQ